MSKAMVVLSGGQDSVTCLWWAKRHFDEISTITFDYGQRHDREVVVAQKIAHSHEWVTSHDTVDLKAAYGCRVQSSLTDHTRDVNEKVGDLPSSFTPGRNLVFLTLAASIAFGRGCRDLVTGVCQTDFSGYPDCREQTIRSLEESLSLGIGDNISIHTPLMYLTKAETVVLARDLGIGCWKDLGETITCYHGCHGGCGDCPACFLRAKGFAEAGLEDPARVS